MGKKYLKLKKKKKYLLIFSIIIIIGFILLLNPDIYYKILEPIKLHEKKAFLQEPIPLSHSYTGSSETHCNSRNCATTVYAGTVFTQEPNGTWYKFSDVSNVKWEPSVDAFNFSYRNYWVTLEPFVIYNGNYKTLQDIRNAFPGVNIGDYVEAKKFNHKFAINFSNVPAGIAKKIDYIGFKLQRANGLTWSDVEKTGNYSIVIKNKVEINYRDLIESGYTLNLVNKTYLLIGNISANYNNGVIWLDPSISLRSTSDIEDTRMQSSAATTNYGTSTEIKVYKEGSPEHRSILKFNIRNNIPPNSNITDCNVSVYNNFLGVVGPPVNISIYRLLRNWSESQATWNNYNTSDAWGTAGANATSDANHTDQDKQTITSADAWYTWDLSNESGGSLHLCQSWLDGDYDDYGVLFAIIEHEGNYKDTSWWSSEYTADLLLRPRVDIQYTAPNPCDGGFCQFNKTYILDDVYIGDAIFAQSDLGVFMKWDIRPLCDDTTYDSIDVAELRFYIDSKTNTPDADVNITYVRNQTWDEQTPHGEIDDIATYNETSDTMSSTTSGTFTNISVLTQVRENCARGDDYLTLRLEDPDNPLSSTLGGRSDSTTLRFGDGGIFGGARYDFASRTYSNDSRKPTLFVEYTLPGITITDNFPGNGTYNTTTGDVNLTCDFTSQDTLSQTNITITRYFGGWNVARNYNTTTGTGNLSYLFNFTNGWYTIECGASTTGGISNQTDPIYHQRGKGVVYVIHRIDTEPESDWNTSLQYPQFDFSSFEESGSNIAEVMNQSWRAVFQDSFGKNNTFVWFIMTEEALCEGNNSACDSVTSRMLYNTTFNWSENISVLNDGKLWHPQHLRDWYNWTWWDANGNCTNCQPASEWNQILTFDDTLTFRNETPVQLTEKLISRFIIDAEFMPIGMATGWTWEDDNLSAWLENRFPIDISNFADQGVSSDSSPPIESVFDWANSPYDVYHPSSTDYRAIGAADGSDMERVMFPCRPGGLDGGTKDSELINVTFKYADNGTDMVLCHFSHNYGGNLMMTDTEALHDSLDGYVNDTYPLVNYSYDNFVQAIQGFFDITNTTGPNITVWLDGNIIFINSSEDLYKDQPFLALRNSTDYFIGNTTLNTTIDPTENLTWQFNRSGLGVIEFRVGAIDADYNTGFSSVFIDQVDLKAPTTENPFTVSFPENITVNFTVVNDADFLTSGVETLNITFENSTNTYSCTLQGNAGYAGSDIWRQNCSVPNLNTGSFDLRIWVNHTDIEPLTDIETSAITYGTCSYSGSGNWNVNCGDNCVITQNTNLPSNTLLLYGNGNFTILANITVGRVEKSPQCLMHNRIGDNNGLLVRIG